MSLLLLFPNIPTTAPPPFVWTVVGKPDTGWIGSNWDYKNVWGEWSLITWGTIQAQSLTWNNLSGYTFASTATGPGTIWSPVLT